MNRLKCIVLIATGLAVLSDRAQAQQFATVADVVIASGDGFDANPGDFDVLLAAVVEADLVGALSNPKAALTVFAPNDAAFIFLARDLGYPGISEEGAWNFIKANASPLLKDVLLYHVVGQELTTYDFYLASFGRQPLRTLQGGIIRPNFVNIIDNDPDAANPLLYAPVNVRTGNGIVHTIAGVLRPIDL